MPWFPLSFFPDRYRRVNQISRLMQIQVHGLVSKLQKFCFRHNYQLDLNTHTQRSNPKSYIVDYCTFFFHFFFIKTFSYIKSYNNECITSCAQTQKIACNINIYCKVHLINERRLKKKCRGKWCKWYDPLVKGKRQREKEDRVISMQGLNAWVKVGSALINQVCYLLWDVKFNVNCIILKTYCQSM